MSPTTDDRAGELARLLELFNQLALSATPGDATVSRPPRRPFSSRVVRPVVTEIPSQTLTAEQLKDFYDASPSMKALGYIPDPWTYDRDNVKWSWTCGRGSTISGTTEQESNDHPPQEGQDDCLSLEGEDDECEEEQASIIKFPMKKKRPFTFKMMLHKVYGPDDRIKKVQESLEQSKKEFKSLSECSNGAGQEKEEEIVEDGNEEVGRDADQGENTDVGFSFATRGESVQKTMSACGRQRSTSVATPSTQYANETDGGGIARAVKKRCVGRRKSLSEPLPSATVGIEGVGRPWVYDAMISHSENEFQITDRASTRGKGRRRAVSVSSGCDNAGDADVRDVRRVVLQTTATAVLEGIE